MRGRVAGVGWVGGSGGRGGGGRAEGRQAPGSVCGSQPPNLAFPSYPHCPGSGSVSAAQEGGGGGGLSCTLTQAGSAQLSVERVNEARPVQIIDRRGQRSHASLRCQPGPREEAQPSPSLVRPGPPAEQHSLYLFLGLEPETRCCAVEPL